MRPALLSLLLLTVAAANAHARLGETPDQLVARYGQPLKEDDQKAENGKVAKATVNFQKGGINVMVDVADGISVRETFTKLNQQPFSVGEARILLNANAQGMQWEAPQPTTQGAKIWTRDDGATARVGTDGTMTITAKSMLNKESTATKQEQKPTLEGF